MRPALFINVQPPEADDSIPPVPEPDLLFHAAMQCFRISCTTANGSPTLTLAASANLVLTAGMTLHGAGIANGTKVSVAAPTSTTVTMTANATASATVWVVFLPAPVVGGGFTILPSSGTWSPTYLTKEVAASGDLLYDDVAAYSGSRYNLTPEWNVSRSQYWLKTTPSATSKIGNSGNNAHRDMRAATGWTLTNVTVAFNVIGIKGGANDANLVTATATDGTLTYAVTRTGQGIFSAYVRRVSGSGTISITRDSGATYTAITSLINSTTWTRVSVESSTENPSVGFKIATSGDSFHIAILNDTNFGSLAALVSPMVNLPYDSVASIATINAVGPTVQGRRYLLECTVKTPSTLHANGAGFTIRNSGSTSYAYLRLYKSGGSLGMIYYTYSGAQRYTGTLVTVDANGRTLHNSPSYTDGEEVKMGLIWGRKQLSVVRWVGGEWVHIGTADGISSTTSLIDPAAMDTINLLGSEASFGDDLKLSHLHSANVVLIGDSITGNRAYDHTYRGVLDPLDFCITNLGAGGDTIASCNTRIGSGGTVPLSTLYDATAARNLVILGIGANTLGDVSNTPAIALGQYATLCATIHAAGFEILAVGVTGRDGIYNIGLTTAQFLAVANTFNAGLTANGADDVILFNSVSEFTNIADTNYYADGLHWTQALYTIAVNSILPRLV